MPPVPSIAQWPYAARLAFVLICITILVYWMSVLAGIITPLLFSIIFAIALYPPAAYLERKKCSRLTAVSITIVLFSLISVGIIWLLAYQITDFSTMWPQLLKKVNQKAILNKFEIILQYSAKVLRFFLVLQTLNLNAQMVELVDTPA